MNKNVKLWLHVLGCSFGLLGVVFVFFRLHAHSYAFDFSRFGMGDLLFVGALSIVCGANNVLLAKAWRQLLLHFGIVVKDLWAIKVYGISQLAKYVPGNIFHLAGRQAMGMAEEIPAVGLAKSILWELAILALSGSLFVTLALPLLWPVMPIIFSLIAFISLVCALSIMLGKLFSLCIKKSMFLHLVYLVVSGVVFFMLMRHVSSLEISISMISALCGAFVIAWSAGFVMPGAPAGVGIREVVLFFLLQPVVVEADLLLAILLGRFTTVAGDCCYFFCAIFINKKQVW